MISYIRNVISAWIWTLRGGNEIDILSDMIDHLKERLHHTNAYIQTLNATDASIQHKLFSVETLAHGTNMALEKTERSTALIVAHCKDRDDYMDYVISMIKFAKTEKIVSFEEWDGEMHLYEKLN